MSCPETIICREYPETWKPGDEPYYPVCNEDSAALLSKYQAEAAKHPQLVVGGRLCLYQYLDMDKSIESTIKVCGVIQ